MNASAMNLFPYPQHAVAGEAALSIYCEGLDHPEGLAFDSDAVLWAGGEGGQIYRIVKSGKVQKVAELGGFCLGLTFSQKQELFVCDLMHHGIHRLDRSGRILEFIGEAAGRELHHPNFSVFDGEGNLYFSESGHWGQQDGCVYRLRANGISEVFAGPFSFTNGLALTAKEDALLVVESAKDRVVRVPIAPDGRSGDITVVADNLARVPDGLAFDSSGNLYVTCYATDCIYRIAPEGDVELFAGDPLGTMLARPTNVAFHPDGGAMFVANLGRWHITRIVIDAVGQPLANMRAEEIESE